MKSFDNERLNAIRESCNGIISELDIGIEWAEHHIGKQEQTSIVESLKRGRRKLRKIDSLLLKKPAIAFFGASQVGKSYLVKNLLCDPGGKLWLRDHRATQSRVNFLKEINPDGGGSESTSVVTRFSVGNQMTSEQLPVKIQLLTPKDLVIILCDSYFSDFARRRPIPRIAELGSVLSRIREATTEFEQIVLREDDIFEIREYLEEQFSNQSDYWANLIEVKYWNELTANIDKVPAKNWSSVLGILWNDNPSLTALFDQLIEELARLDFARGLQADFDIADKNKGAILNVSSLKKFWKREKEQYWVQKPDQSMLQVNAGIICALAAEIEFQIEEETLRNRADLIENNDILDFPGARSRLKMTEESGKMSEELLAQMLLRGKVSYLFNKYSSNYEVSNLCVCSSATRQPDGRSVPSLIQRWIDHNVGSTVEGRSKVLTDSLVPPLFVIFTFWNERLHHNSETQSEDFSEKLETTFRTRFEEDLKSDSNWAEQWKLNELGERIPFQNFFLLRDFIYSDNVFERQSDHTEGNPLPNQIKSLQKFQDLFKSSPLVKEFFKDPSKAWNASSTPGNDGSQWILDQLRQSANNWLRTLRYVDIIESVRKSTLEQLDRHFHSSDADQKIRRACENYGEISIVMDIIFDNGKAYSSNFGSFLESLCIGHHELYSHFHNLLRKSTSPKEQTGAQAYVLLRARNPELNPNRSFDANLGVLCKNYDLPSQETTLAYFESLGINLHRLFFLHHSGLDNQSDILAEEARDYWFHQKLQADHFISLQEKGFSINQLEFLFSNLKLGFEVLNVSSHIAKSIRHYVDRYYPIAVAEEMVAHIAADSINNYVTSMGWLFFSDEKKEQVRRVIERAPFIQLEIPPNNERRSHPKLEDSGELFGTIRRLYANSKQKDEIPGDILAKIPMLNNLKTWNHQLKIAFIANCEIPTYDVEANRRLGELLVRLRTYQIGYEQEIILK